MPQVSKMNHSYLTTYYRFFFDLFHSSKKGSKVRAARRREISDLGFSSDLRQCGDLVSLRRFHHAGAKQTNLSESDHDQGDAQHRTNPEQTGWVTDGFWSRMVTKRVRLVGSACHLGSKNGGADDL